jgi:rhamnulokinase
VRARQQTTRVAAIDLGSASGRVTSVDFDGQRVDFTVAHRFETKTTSDNGLRWDIEFLTNEVFDGMGRLGVQGIPIASIGVDSWGVDYVLVDHALQLVDAPFSYRDPRNNAPFDSVLAELGPDLLYNASGSQLLAINTAFGLVSDSRDTPERLARSSRMLMIADYIHQLLSGVTVSERTLASTTGLYDPIRGDWSTELIAKLGLPRELFSELVDPGTRLGPMLDFQLPGWDRTEVITPGSHDTASAVLAAPFDSSMSENSAFISSGSWSLIGREQPGPIVTRAARLAELTNETGFGNRTLMLRNSAGMWLLQESRRQWQSEGQPLEYDEIAALAEFEEPLRSIIDPDALEFVATGDIPARIREFCVRTGQPIPESIGQIARTIIDSLALRYRNTLDSIAAVTGVAIDAVHVVGGGSQHAGLAKATADATRVPIHCGPVEATALGNAGAQLIALGELSGMSDLRSVIAASSVIRTTEPGPVDLWDRAGDRFQHIVAHHSQTTGTKE